MGITVGYTSPTYMMCGCVWINMDNVRRTAIWMGKINYDKQWNYRVPLSRQTNTIILLTNLELRHLNKWEIGHTQIGNSANKYENVLFSVWTCCTEELDDILQLILGDQDRNDTCMIFSSWKVLSWISIVHTCCLNGWAFDLWTIEMLEQLPSSVVEVYDRMWNDLQLSCIFRLSLALSILDRQEIVDWSCTFIGMTFI